MSASQSSREFRVEHDSMGPVQVPTDRIWGAQTQRSCQYFAAGGERFRWGRAVIRAFGIVKKSAALANLELHCCKPEIFELIEKATSEVIDGQWDEEFPLVVFQTGSGTQTNMNANEVIANRANLLAGHPLGSHIPVHPNDDVNRGQSSNDVFPTAMHVAIVEQLERCLFPSLRDLIRTLQAKSDQYMRQVMVGRTHLQDAVPVTLGQVISGWEAQLTQALTGLQQSMCGLYELAIGGTAVGTGINTHPHFGDVCARYIADETGHPFLSAANKFAALSAHDPVVNVSASLRTLAGACMKVANDVRWYSSGPRCGIGELTIPENEPGSSIMPGKINPTQCEALTMIAVHVFGNDHAVAFAGSQGNFQLNVFKPVMLQNVLESIQLLADGCQAFHEHCIQGMEPNQPRIEEHLQASLMLVTALTPLIGYEKAAEIALMAHRSGLSLRAAALQSGHVTTEQFDKWVRPQEFVGISPISPSTPPGT